MRVAILWQMLSGYFGACATALAKAPGTELMVVWREADSEAPFSLDQSAWSDFDYRYPVRPDGRILLQRLEAFRPDVLLVNSWHVSAYRAALRRFSGRSVRVLCMDNQWLGTAKQWLGVMTAPWVVRPLYDRVFLPGARQADFARRLGFHDRQITRGLYSCDHEAFTRIHEARSSSETADDFLFVGRLVPEKGADLLAPAFRRYRALKPDGPPLTVCGTGPLAASLEGTGIRALGFMQPDRLPEVFRTSGCLLLPSRFEPWGVVIHEATTAGLSVICSRACGAADDLVEPGVNGSIAPVDDVTGLADAMVDYANAQPAQRTAARCASHRLSQRFTPQKWAELVLNFARSDWS